MFKKKKNFKKREEGGGKLFSKTRKARGEERWRINSIQAANLSIQVRNLNQHILAEETQVLNPEL